MCQVAMVIMVPTVWEQKGQARVREGLPERAMESLHTASHQTHQHKQHLRTFLTDSISQENGSPNHCLFPNGH